MRSQSQIARLYAARKALAALIVHDGLPLHSAFQQIDREIEHMLNFKLTEKARKVLEDAGQVVPVEARQPEPKPVPAPEPVPEPATSRIRQRLDNSRLVDTREAAAFLGKTKASIEMDRHTAKKKNRPPKIPYLVSDTRVFYRMRDLIAHKEALDAKFAELPGAEDLLNEKEAADALRVEPKSLRFDRANARREEREPRVPFVKPDRRVFYRRSDLEQTLATNPPWLQHMQATLARHQGG